MGASKIEDVIAWQLADQFKVNVYQLLRAHPDANSDFRYRDQLRTSAASVAMNIAEGFYRFNGRDFARHLSIALASLGEAVLWLRDGVDRGYFKTQECDEAFVLAKRCRVATLKFRSALLESVKGKEDAERADSRMRSRRN